MKILVVIAIFVTINYFSLSTVAVAAPQRAVKAAADVLALSQQITKNYIYIGQDIQIDKATARLTKSMKQLAGAIKVIESNTTDVDAQNMVRFLKFTYSEIAKVVDLPYSKESGALMIDYSETLLEGAESLTQRWSKKTDKQGFIELERQALLVERIAKYYIAHRAGFVDFNAVRQLETAVEQFESGLVKINAQKKYYPVWLHPEIEKLNRHWPITKDFYLGVEKNDLPLIVFVYTEYIRKAVDVLLTYHAKEM